MLRIIFADSTSLENVGGSRRKRNAVDLNRPTEEKLTFKSSVSTLAVDYSANSSQMLSPSLMAAQSRSVSTFSSCATSLSPQTEATHSSSSRRPATFSEDFNTQKYFRIEAEQMCCVTPSVSSTYASNYEPQKYLCGDVPEVPPCAQLCTDIIGSSKDPKDLCLGKIVLHDHLMKKKTFPS